MGSILGITFKTRRKRIVHSHDNVVRLCKLAMRDGMNLGISCIFNPEEYSLEKKNELIDNWVKENVK